MPRLLSAALFFAFGYLFARSRGGDHGSPTTQPAQTEPTGEPAPVEAPGESPTITPQQRALRARMTSTPLGIQQEVLERTLNRIDCLMLEAERPPLTKTARDNVIAVNRYTVNSFIEMLDEAGVQLTPVEALHAYRWAWARYKRGG